MKEWCEQLLEAHAKLKKEKQKLGVVLLGMDIKFHLQLLTDHDTIPSYIPSALYEGAKKYEKEIQTLIDTSNLDDYYSTNDFRNVALIIPARISSLLVFLLVHANLTKKYNPSIPIKNKIGISISLIYIISFLLSYTSENNSIIDGYTAIQKLSKNPFSTGVYQKGTYSLCNFVHSSINMTKCSFSNKKAKIFSFPFKRSSTFPFITRNKSLVLDTYHAQRHLFGLAANTICLVSDLYNYWYVTSSSIPTPIKQLEERNKDFLRCTKKVYSIIDRAEKNQQEVQQLLETKKFCSLLPNHWTLEDILLPLEVCQLISAYTYEKSICYGQKNGDMPIFLKKTKVSGILSPLNLSVITSWFCTLSVIIAKKSFDTSANYESN